MIRDGVAQNGGKPLLSKPNVPKMLYGGLIELKDGRKIPWPGFGPKPDHKSGGCWLPDYNSRGSGPARGDWRAGHWSQHPGYDEAVLTRLDDLFRVMEDALVRGVPPEKVMKLTMKRYKKLNQTFIDLAVNGAKIGPGRRQVMPLMRRDFDGEILYIEDEIRDIWLSWVTAPTKIK